jgi:hypothetical protein
MFGPTSVRKLNSHVILCRMQRLKGDETFGDGFWPSTSGFCRRESAHPLTPGTQVRVTLREMSAIARVCYCNRVNDGFDQGLHVQELRER